MKLITLTLCSGHRVAIPISAITGVVETDTTKTFVQTGCDKDEADNGWLVEEEWSVVCARLESFESN